MSSIFKVQTVRRRKPIGRRVVAPLVLLSWAFVMWSGPAVAAEAARPFAHPDRIRYDNQCLTIDGKDVFIFSGAFHYFRCPREFWRDRFQKIKEAGFNTVETYAAWNWHERQMPGGLGDYSKMNLDDLEAWLKMAEGFGFYIIVRPGPYICAEWDMGGFPQWLMNKKPKNPRREQAWLRSDDPAYLAWCQHWYDAVCPVIARHQITRKASNSPGVILVQVENEYDYASLPSEIMLNQVRALVEAARAKGIDVPLFTCWTHPVRGSADPLLRDVFDACNFYPRWNVNSVRANIDKLRREQPDAPLATTELQGGWFAQVGGKLSEDQEGVTASQINNLTLFTIQNGETILNYYMLFGGTNPGDWAARDLITSYDYNAPIRECGGVGDRYQRVWALGHMLAEHGPRLARSEAVACETSTSSKDVTLAMRRAKDGARYLFIRTSQHREPRQGTARIKEKQDGPAEVVVDYDLEPFGSKVLFLPVGATNAVQGEWLPKPAPEIERPAKLPWSVPITSALVRIDGGPSHWRKWMPGQTLAEAGVWDDRFIFYQATISSRVETNLLIEFPAKDRTVASINGKLLTCTTETASRAAFPIPPGRSEVRLLYEDRGHPNIGRGMENPAGLRAALLTRQSLSIGTPISGWRMREVEGTTNRPEIKPDFPDQNWRAVEVEALDANTLPPRGKAVYRATINMTADDLKAGKMTLNFGRIDDLGWVFVNGTNVGKTTDWSLPYSFDVTKQLHAGTNVVAVVVQNNDGGGGLGAPTFETASDSAPAPFKSFGSARGFDEKWWEPDLKEKGWTAASIPTPAETLGASLAWYRLEFKLPRVESSIWTPWRLRLNAIGNGFLYLNGKPLGRYWQAGPQHAFFLPECWLNFGDQNRNVLTLCLNGTDKGASILSAIVEPYGEFAEKRQGAKGTAAVSEIQGRR
jgi:hypothetical protein